MGKTVVAEQRLLAQINQRMEKAGNWNLINNLEEKKRFILVHKPTYIQ